LQLQYLKEKKDSPAIAAVGEEMEDMLARGQLELPVTVYFAASKGDDYLIHQLLKRGHDPNDSDKYGHTALVMKTVVISTNLFGSTDVYSVLEKKLTFIAHD
jgi:precorrin-4 methylase